MEKKFRQKEIPERKVKDVDSITHNINKSKSIVVVSIKNLPTNQFQQIKKQLREKANVKVAKKSIILRAIDKTEKGNLKHFKDFIKEDSAIMFSELDAFELAGILSKNRSMSRAKIGQIVPEDVIIEPGPTELVPGPIISELGSLGIKFEIQEGKINIKEAKTIVKAGNPVTEEAAGIMGKLDIKPIPVGLIPLAAYDIHEGKIYENIRIDTEKTLKDLKELAGRALAFAVGLNYASKDTINYLLMKAASHEAKLSSLIKTQENTKEEK